MMVTIQSCLFQISCGITEPASMQAGFIRPDINAFHTATGLSLGRVFTNGQVFIQEGSNQPVINTFCRGYAILRQINFFCAGFNFYQFLYFNGT